MGRRTGLTPEHISANTQPDPQAPHQRLTCFLTASASPCSLCTVRVSSAISFLVSLRLSPCFPAVTCSSSYWRPKKCELSNRSRPTWVAAGPWTHPHGWMSRLDVSGPSLRGAQGPRPLTKGEGLGAGPTHTPEPAILSPWSGTRTQPQPCSSAQSAHIGPSPQR